MKKDKKTNTESLGGRLKGYESEFEMIIPSENHLMIRIDGHHFSSFTKGFKKPFDNILSETMVKTTEDLVDRFDAYTGYTQSDEITLFLPSLKDITVDDRKKKTHKLHKRIRDDWQHSFSGRTQKIASLVAAYTTIRFNYHFNKLLSKETKENGESIDEFIKYINLLQSKLDSAYFDCRVFGVPDEDEVFNTFMWRNRDCLKNSQSMFSRSYCSHRELQNKNGQEQIQYCLEKTEKDWNLIEDKFKYGTFIKKELYLKETEENNQVQRSRIIRLSKRLTEFSKENIDLITRKYL